VSNRDRKNGVPTTATSIPLVDPHAMPENPSIGDLVRDATTQVSTLVRAEVELAKSEITRDVKKGLTGSVFFILALVVLLYSTFFMFFFLAELLDTWLWRWAAFLIVFVLMLVVTAVFAFLGYRKVRRIHGPQQTIESVKETTAALTPGLAKFSGTPAPAATTPAPRPYPVRTTGTAAGVTAGTSAAIPAAHTAEVAHTKSGGHAADQDPTAAVYANTGLPVTKDDDSLPGDPSGW
jgi:MFS family permease